MLDPYDRSNAEKVIIDVDAMRDRHAGRRPRHWGRPRISERVRVNAIASVHQ